MSGGELTDYKHDLYRLTEWADHLTDDPLYSNPTLGLLLCDLEECLTVADKALSGDTAPEKADEAWNEFVEAWHLVPQGWTR